MQLLDLSGQRFGRFSVITRQGSTKSGQARWLCQCDCGQQKTITGDRLRTGETQSCGCLHKERMKARRGSAHPSWKNGQGRWVNPDGYVVLRNPEFFPGHEKYARHKQGFTVLEHIVVMSQHLGRPLYPGETVHHKNGIRHDNNIDNLELKASSHGSGQTIPDLVAWAKEILQRYAQ